MEQWSVFIELLLVTLITAAVPAVIGLTYKWLMLKVNEGKRHIPSDVQYIIASVAQTVAWAAEQSGLKDELLKEGKLKKEWALQYGEDLLESQLSLILDLDKLGDVFWESVLVGLDVEIEATIGQEFNRKKLNGDDSPRMMGRVM